MKIISPFLVTWFFILLGTAHGEAQYGLDFEFGGVMATRGEARIPSDTGTTFDVADYASGFDFFYRITPRVILFEKHEIRGLYAPLSIAGNGTPTTDINFRGDIFGSGEDTRFVYKFNSYRLSYIYHFDPWKKWRFRLGFTNKIRDAKVELENATQLTRRTDIGYVPLIHLGLSYYFTDKIFLDLDVDALAAPQGRAEDVALRFGYKLPKGLEMLLGYRLVEGGADTSNVYTFAFFHYVTAALRYSIPS